MCAAAAVSRTERYTWSYKRACTVSVTDDEAAERIGQMRVDDDDYYCYYCPNGIDMLKLSTTIILLLPRARQLFCGIREAFLRLRTLRVCACGYWKKYFSPRNI